MSCRGISNMSLIARRIAPPRAVHWRRSIPFIAKTDASSLIEMTKRALLLASRLGHPRAKETVSLVCLRDKYEK